MALPVSSSQKTAGSSSFSYGQNSVASATETTGQAFSRIIEQAALTICAIRPDARLTKEYRANSQMPTKHFQNTFDNPQLEKRSVRVLVDQRWEEQPLNPSVSAEELQKKNQVQKYNPGNERFSIESLLKSDHSSSHSVLSIDRHQSFEPSDISTNNQDRIDAFSRPSLQVAIIKPQENRAQQQDQVECDSVKRSAGAVSTNSGNAQKSRKRPVSDSFNAVLIPGKVAKNEPSTINENSGRSACSGSVRLLTIVSVESSQKTWAQSEKGKAYERSEKRKAYLKAYEQSAKRKAYEQSAKRKVSKKTWAQSEKGKASKKAWAQSEKGKASKKAWAQSEKGKAYLKAYLKAYDEVFSRTGDREQAKMAGKQASAPITKLNKLKTNKAESNAIPSPRFSNRKLKEYLQSRSSQSHPD